jgi:solute carrier family 25 carnitine/acylcarnitine transporter 20/29
MDAAAGWVGGAASTLVVQPCDTVLTRMQASALATTATTTATTTTNWGGGARATLGGVVSRGGYGALWRGFSAMTAAIPAQNAALFAGYGAGERAARQLAGRGETDATATTGLAYVFAGGTVGGVAQSFVVSPFELVKVAQQQSVERSGYEAAASLAKRVGSVGLLTRGLGATLLRDGIPHGVWFVAYEWAKMNWTDRFNVDGDSSPSPVGSMTCGAFAGSVAWAVGYPFDTIKTRVQASAVRGESLTIREAVSSLVAERALYRGFGLKLLRTIPSSAVCFVVYEEAMRAMGG